MTTILEMQNINLKYFAKNISTTALLDVNLKLNYGDIGCILGPSGCGKTSLLKTIAGFSSPQEGKITINGKKVYDATTINFNLTPENRNIGMVFQDYALFPHLNVENNILFALTRGLPATASRKQISKCQEMLELTGLEHRRKSFIHQLSGGQQQRVSLARALAPSPQILLLDEPFSNLDPNLRSELCKDVFHILKSTKTTALMVTHDQQEAFSIADKIGIIFAGSLEQWSTPYDIYHKPQSAEIAQFIGEGAFISGTISKNYVNTPLGSFKLKNFVNQKQNNDNRVRVLLRPDDIIHDDKSSLKAKVVKKDFRGSNFLYTLQLENGEKVLSLVPSHHNHPVEEPIGIYLEMDHVITFTTKQPTGLFTNSI